MPPPELQASSPPKKHRLERGYIETKDSADAYVTEGALSMQPQQQVIVPEGGQAPVLPMTATFEVTKDEWEQIE